MYALCLYNKNIMNRFCDVDGLNKLKMSWIIAWVSEQA